MAAGASSLSDPIALVVAPGAELSVSLYLPERIDGPTGHALALKHAVISRPGDHTRDPVIAAAATSESSVLLSAVLVPARRGQRVIVAFGDSLVDGDGSSLDQDRNWPSALALRLRANVGQTRWTVVNAGIAGNRLLSDGPFPSLGASALSRFERDALGVPGVTHIILQEGNNDLGFPGATLGGVSLATVAGAPTAADVITADQALIARAHRRGVKVIGATLAPFEGATIPGYASAAKDAKRQAVNAWIRTSGVFDGVLDVDQVLRDPDHPSRLAPRLASDDHMHPNDDGYQAIAAAVDLARFR